MAGREWGTGRAGRGSGCGGRRRSGGGSDVAETPTQGGSSLLPADNRVGGSWCSQDYSHYSNYTKGSHDVTVYSPYIRNMYTSEPNSKF